MVVVVVDTVLAEGQLAPLPSASWPVFARPGTCAPALVVVCVWLVALPLLLWEAEAEVRSKVEEVERLKAMVEA